MRTSTRDARVPDGRSDATVEPPPKAPSSATADAFPEGSVSPPFDVPPAASADASRGTSAGRAIHRHRWNPADGARTRPRGVYLLHGMSEHAARYERLAAHLADLGWRVGAHDHPGHGRSDGRRGFARGQDGGCCCSSARV